MINIHPLIQDAKLSSTVGVRKLAQALEQIQAELNKIAGPQGLKNLQSQISTTQGSITSATSVPGGSIVITGEADGYLAANDLGLRLIEVTIYYTPPIPPGAFSRVGIWTKGPTDTAPVYQGECMWDGLLANSIAIFALFPPAADATYDLWLTKGTATVMEQLDVTKSAHAIFGLHPIPPSTSGQEWLPVVTGLSITSQTYFVDANGVYRCRLNVTWTPPSDARFAGVDLIEEKPGPVYQLLGRFTASPATVQLEVPALVQSHFIWAPSVSKQGQRNSLSGVCPKVGFTIGDTLGKLDLSKALAASLAPALSIVANVLGITPYGITESLIAQFAVSQAKLANAPIIDTARIVDAAVTTAKIEALAVNTALIANAAVTNAKIGALAVGTANIQDLAVTSAKIGSLSVAKLTGWGGYNINVGTGLTIGQVIINSYGIQPSGTYFNITLGVGLLTAGSAVINGGLECQYLNTVPSGTRGYIHVGDITGYSLSVGAGDISGGDITGSNLDVGAGSVSGQDAWFTDVNATNIKTTNYYCGANQGQTTNVTISGTTLHYTGGLLTSVT